MAPKIEINQVATFTVTGNVSVSGNRDNADRLVFAMLAPRVWKIRYNTTVTYRADEELDWDEEQTMSVIPDSSSPRNMSGYTWPEALMERCGLGTNRYNDMEWVAWQADVPVQLYSGSKPNYEITIKCKVSDDNLIASLGFFVNDIEDGLTTDTQYYKVVYSDAFTVYGGKGETIDYSKVRFNSAEPSRALQDDFITFTFAGEAYDNDLISCDEIFFEATAKTDKGNSYLVNKRSDETLMTREDTFSHSYSLTIWPAGFFGVPDDETITSIEYKFTNRDGSIFINKSVEEQLSGDTPDSLDDPFTFTMLCD
jgi:hypothetical protein